MNIVELCEFSCKMRSLINWGMANFTSVWDPLTRWLPKGVLKRGYLEICLTTFFGVRIFINR